MAEEIKSQYKTGEKPPEGTYTCMECSGNNPASVIVPEMVKVLPVCPKCGGRTWYKS